jgi:hypothetical protein
MTIDFTDFSSIITGIGTIIIPVWVVVMFLSLILNWLFSGIVKGRL